MRPPAPAASRGGLGAREQPLFFASDRIFESPRQARKQSFWMILCRDGAEEFSGDFFSLRFFGGCPWAGHPGPAAGPHRRAADTDGANPRLHGAPPWTMGVGGATFQTNQTSNQTSGRSLVSWPRLPRFGHFPFHFPFRGEKGSDPRGRPKHGERGGHQHEVLAGATGTFFVSPP